MIRVSELIDELTRAVSKDINVLSCYISIDERNNVIRFRIPMERRQAKEQENAEGGEGKTI